MMRSASQVALSRLTLLPIIALVLVTGILVLQIHSLESSAASLDHSDAVIARMHSLQRLMIDEETGLRGYLLTSRPEFLEPYTLGRGEVDGDLAELQRLLSDDPEQLKLLNQIAQENSEWVTGATRRLGQSESRAQIISGGLEGKRRMDHIRLLIAQFIQHEDQLRTNSEHRASYLSSAALAVLSVAVLVAAGFIFFQTQRLYQSHEMYRNLAQRHSEREMALNESEARYRTLFESIDEGFCIIEVIFDQRGKPNDYKFIETNPSFGKQTGLVAAQGKTMREFAPEMEQHWFDMYGQVALTGEPARFQNRAEQLHRWFDAYAFRIGPPEKRRVAVLFQDISDRKRTEEALLESEERFRALYERAPVGIEQVAPDGRLLKVNSTQCAILGYSEAELLLKTFEDITHPDDRATEAALLRRMFVGEQDSYSLEKRYLPKSGNPVWVNITSTAVRDHSGSLEYRITVVEDITARRRAEQALIHAEKLAVTGRMASVMAHEINNPLGAALNSLYLASLARNLSDATCRHLELAQHELERVAHITRQTLGFYRETGNPTKVDLQTVVDDVMNLYESELKKKRIRVEQRYGTDQTVFGIEGELRQILSNLVNNSIDTVSDNGCIRLRVAGPSSLDGDRPRIRLTVGDNGSGIDPQHLGRVFEPFFSVKKSISTGLGLWVTQQLVKKHDGKILIRSKPGLGTVLQVFLPVERRTPNRLSQDLDQDVQATL